MLKNKYIKILSDIYSHQYTQLIINLISIFIIVRFSFLFLKTISDVVSYTIYNHSDFKQQQKVVGNNLFLHSILLYIPIFLSLISICLKKIDLKHFVISLLLSYLALKYQWFDILHNAIKDTFIFDILRQHGRTVINNQYTRIICYLLLIILLIIQVAYKKHRSLSRIMVLLMTSSCLITVSVFHIAIPMGMFKYIVEDKTQLAQYEIENLEKKDICNNKSCYYLYPEGKVEIIKNTNHITDIQQYNYIISKEMYFINVQKKSSYSEAVNVNSGFLFDYDIITMKKEGDKYFTTIDNISLRKFSRESEIMFSFLAIMAHFVWIFGGLVLLEFHNYKFKKRASNNLIKDEK